MKQVGQRVSLSRVHSIKIGGTKLVAEISYLRQWNINTLNIPCRYIAIKLNFVPHPLLVVPEIGLLLDCLRDGYLALLN